MNNFYDDHKNYICKICPRECGARRYDDGVGFCGAAGGQIFLARAALHMWEEPCISGTTGSGAVFFSGCTLRCSYCQNFDIARSRVGKAVSIERLAQIFLELQQKRAHNINLVTPTHYSLEIIEAVKLARERGLIIPIVYNCSGYEKVETLKLLEGIVDIYLTDFKYVDNDMALKYSSAKNYPELAKLALAEMHRQQPEAMFDASGMMQKGVIVRHLVLPGYVKHSKKIIKYLHDTYGDEVYISLMNQYTPLERMLEDDKLYRRVTKREYNRAVDYALELGMEKVFIQEGDTADESFIPAFDYEGV